MDGDNDARAGIGAAPEGAAAPEWRADLELVVLHWQRRLN
jgi:hypothetical protein